MPRPWFRSRLFWLGLAVLISLVWAWRHAGTNAAGLIWETPERQVTLAHFKASLRLVVRNQDRPPATLTPFRTYSSLPVGEKLLLPFRPLGFGFPEAFYVRDVTHPDFPDQKVVQVAYWFLTLLFLAAWLGALVVWQGRKHRLHARRATPPPGDGR